MASTRKILVVALLIVAVIASIFYSENRDSRRKGDWYPLFPSSKIVEPIYGNEIFTCKGDSYLGIDESRFVAQSRYSIEFEYKTGLVDKQFLFGTSNPLLEPTVYMQLILTYVRVDYLNHPMIAFVIKSSDGESNLILRYRSDSLVDPNKFVRIRVERNEAKYSLSINDEIVDSKIDVLPRRFSSDNKFFFVGRPYKSFAPAVRDFVGCVRFVKLNGDARVPFYPGNSDSFSVVKVC